MAAMILMPIILITACIDYSYHSASQRKVSEILKVLFNFLKLNFEGTFQLSEVVHRLN